MEKKKIEMIIGVISIIVVIIGIFVCIDKNKEHKEDAEALKLKEKLTVEFLENVKVSDFIEDLQGELLEDNKIETSSIGEKEVTFKYNSIRNKEKTKSVKINIVDTTKPEIYMSETMTVIKGYNKDLTDTILSGDNCDSNPTRKIEGEYNVNEVGTYNLKFVITDASGNENSKNFTLNVVNSIKTTQNVQKKIEFSEVLSKYKMDNTELGIDVSKWQGEIDWQTVKNAGTKFTFIRVGYQNGFDGENVEDEYFKANIEGAKEVGLDVGIYFYSYAKTINEIEDQVEWISNKLENYKIDLPIAFDWESWSSFNNCKLSFYDINNMAQTYIKMLENKGYKASLYSSKNYLEKIWYANEYENIWLANYTTKTEYNGNYQYWQCCNTGKIDGINGDVDIDIYYK